MDELFHEVLQRALQNPPEAEQAAPQGGGSSKKEGSKLATSMFLGGAAGDIGSTIYGMKHGLKEANPLYSWAGNKGTIPLMAGVKAGSYLLGKKFIQPHHPKIFNALLMGSGVLDGLGTANNLLKAKFGGSANSSETPPGPNMIKLPDGSWIDPAYFPGYGK